jgi:hypothetical protein
VVCDTEKRRSGNSFRRRLQSVVFPAPEGEETMRRRKSSAEAPRPVFPGSNDIGRLT